VVSERRVDLKVIPGGAAESRRAARAGPEPGPPRRLFGKNADPPATTVGPYEVGLRPVDLVILVYLAVTACLMVAFQAQARTWGALALAHLVAGALLLRMGASDPPRSTGLRILRDFYPLPAMALFYAEYTWLTRLTGSGLHDATIAGWEQSLFGMQPSQELHMLLPWPWLSPYLHAAYFTYYLVPVALLGALYARGRWSAFQEAMTTTLLAFVSCGLFFIAYPVAGPYHHFGRPDLGWLGGGFVALTHAIIDRGSSVGTAFPSSHTAIAVAVWVSALRLSPKTFWALAFVVPALALGTVYGGFHYALDSLAGFAWGAGIGVVGPRLHGYLAQRLPRSKSRPKVAPGVPLPKTGDRA
jgi:membrane-associated phospholipid phosphatase